MKHNIVLKGYGAYLPTTPSKLLCLGTAESYGIEQIHITPGADWENLLIKATFHPPSGDSVVVVLGEDGIIDVPPEATAVAAGEYNPGLIVFSGVSDGVQRISANLAYTVIGHAPVEGKDSTPTPSQWEQLAEQYQSKVDKRQGSENAGKVLGIGDDGMVKPVEQTGGGVQPDWNQNDETAPDYVKNRPFWSEEPVETVVFDGVIDISDDGYEFETPISIKSSQEFIVIFDDVEYEVTAILCDDTIIVGSTALWYDEYNEAEPPFVFNRTFFYAAVSGEHTVRIIERAVIHQKINNKYLPDAMLNSVNLDEFSVFLFDYKLIDIANGDVYEVKSEDWFYFINALRETKISHYQYNLNGRIHYGFCAHDIIDDDLVKIYPPAMLTLMGVNDSYQMLIFETKYEFFYKNEQVTVKKSTFKYSSDPIFTREFE